MEQVANRAEVESISRRTDDILFNVRFLVDHIIDKETEAFLPQAETDVLEQISSETSEADVQKFAVTVYQRLDPELGQYVSLGAGTVDHSKTGRDALDLDDEDNWFEYYRRDVEVIREEKILEPDIQSGMQAGGVKADVSPSPTYHEVDPDIAISFGYDDRTMLILQGLSPDGQTKIMKTFSVFDVPAEAWAKHFNNKHTMEAASTALAVMQVSNDLPLMYGSFEEALTTLLQGVREYLSETQQASVDSQLDAFLEDQEALAEQVDYYSREKLAFQKELALSWGSWARPAVMSSLLAVQDKLNPEAKLELSKRMTDNGLHVDDYVASLLVKLNTVMIDNRAGLATHNERTIRRIAPSIGLDTTIAMAQAEHFIQAAIKNEENVDFMVRRIEQQLADSGASCGGGCSVNILDLFSREANTAREAGLKGTLYESTDLDKSSKCSCVKKSRKAKVISDGKSVVCVTCGDFKVNGKRGSIKQPA